MTEQSKHFKKLKLSEAQTLNANKALEELYKNHSSQDLNKDIVFFEDLLNSYTKSSDINEDLRKTISKALSGEEKNYKQVGSMHLRFVLDFLRSKIKDLSAETTSGDDNSKQLVNSLAAAMAPEEVGQELPISDMADKLRRLNGITMYGEKISYESWRDDYEFLSKTRVDIRRLNGDSGGYPEMRARILWILRGVDYSNDLKNTPKINQEELNEYLDVLKAKVASMGGVENADADIDQDSATPEEKPQEKHERLKKLGATLLSDLEVIENSDNYRDHFLRNLSKQDIDAVTALGLKLKIQVEANGTNVDELEITYDNLSNRIDTLRSEFGNGSRETNRISLGKPSGGLNTFMNKEFQIPGTKTKEQKKEQGERDERVKEVVSSLENSFESFLSTEENRNDFEALATAAEIRGFINGFQTWLTANGEGIKDFHGSVDVVLGDDEYNDRKLFKDKDDLIKGFVIYKKTREIEVRRRADDKDKKFFSKLGSNLRQGVVGGVKTSLGFGVGTALSGPVAALLPMVPSKELKNIWSRLGTNIEGKINTNDRLLLAQLRLAERNVRNIGRFGQIYNRLFQNFDNIGVYEKAMYSSASSALTMSALITLGIISMPATLTGAVALAAGVAMGKTTLTTLLSAHGILNKEYMRGKNDAEAIRKYAKTILVGLGIGLPASFLGATFGSLALDFFREEVLSNIVTPANAQTVTSKPPEAKGSLLGKYFGGTKVLDSDQVNVEIKKVQDFTSTQQIKEYVNGLSVEKIKAIGPDISRMRSSFFEQLNQEQFLGMTVDQKNAISGAQWRSVNSAFLSEMRGEVSKLKPNVDKLEGILRGAKRNPAFLTFILKSGMFGENNSISNVPGMNQKSVLSQWIENSGLEKRAESNFLFSFGLKRDEGSGNIVEIIVDQSVPKPATPATQPAPIQTGPRPTPLPAPSSVDSSKFLNPDQLARITRTNTELGKAAKSLADSLAYAKKFEDTIPGRLNGVNRSKGDRITALVTDYKAIKDSMSGPLGKMIEGKPEMSGKRLSDFTGHQTRLAAKMAEINAEIERLKPSTQVPQPQPASKPITPAPAEPQAATRPRGTPALEKRAETQPITATGTKAQVFDLANEFKGQRNFNPGKVEFKNGTMTIGQVPTSHAVWNGFMQQNAEFRDLKPLLQNEVLRRIDEAILYQSGKNRNARSQFINTLGVKKAGLFDRNITYTKFNLDEMKRLFNITGLNEAAIRNIITEVKRG